MLNRRNFKLNKTPMSHDRELIEYVQLLRYGPSSHRDIKKPLLSATAVSKALRIPNSTIYMLKIGRAHV